ncbi:MAG TPA: hypothetical protein PKI78_04635, partial [Anaerolineales bacterium]|nr:hypothetical protein [Anaerolineales bacterium]
AWPDASTASSQACGPLERWLLADREPGQRRGDQLAGAGHPRDDRGAVAVPGAQLEQHGVKITERLPHILPTNEHNLFYLQTKAAKSGHMIDFRGKEHLREQSDPAIVEGMTEDQITALYE